MEQLSVSLLQETNDIEKVNSKENAHIFVDYLCESINSMFKSSMLPNSLKLADITPLHKKGSKELNEDYKSVSILPTLSKSFERIIFAKMSAFFDNDFSQYKYGFRKGYSTQHCYLKMLEKLKKCVDKGKVFGGVLTDLSKAFDCLDHKQLTAKLNAYSLTTCQI